MVFLLHPCSGYQVLKDFAVKLVLLRLCLDASDRPLTLLTTLRILAKYPTPVGARVEDDLRKNLNATKPPEQSKGLGGIRTLTVRTKALHGIKRFPNVIT